MFAAFLRARLKSLGGTQFRDAHLRAAAALQERGDRLAALRHAMAVGDMQLAAAILADSMHTILEFTDAQEARAVARAWLARFGDAAAEANPEQLLQFVLPLASAGQREAEGWLTKVNQAHPALPPGLDALAHGTWAAYYNNVGSTGLRWSTTGWPARRSTPRPGRVRCSRCSRSCPCRKPERTCWPVTSRLRPPPSTADPHPCRSPSWTSSAHPSSRPGWHSCRATWSQPPRRWTGLEGLPRNTTPWRTG